MATALADQIKVIDSDAHVIEPHDLWTSRLSKKWGDQIPRVIKNPRGPRPDGRHDDVWLLGDKVTMYTASGALAGTACYLPDHPSTLADALAASYDPRERIRWMDENGVYAQTLYPNVAGFGSHRMLQLKDPALMIECVQAYNDFLVEEWCSVAPERFIPIMAIPFWDVQASVKEIERCAQMGYKGILGSGRPELSGQPVLHNPYWDPLWAAAQDCGLAFNFHVGSGGDMADSGGSGPFAGIKEELPGVGRYTTMQMREAMTHHADNKAAIATAILGGVCRKFPTVKFVSVESGVGWVPSFVEALDWNWDNRGAGAEHRDWEMKPSEYFRRQVYGTFWFETDSALAALTLYPDNCMFETDFPHPTGIAEGPVSSSGKPREWIEKHMGAWPRELAAKALHDTAATIYGVDD